MVLAKESQFDSVSAPPNGLEPATGRLTPLPANLIEDRLELPTRFLLVSEENRYDPFLSVSGSVQLAAKRCWLTCSDGLAELLQDVSLGRFPQWNRA
jgi:hypothetical protein